MKLFCEEYDAYYDPDKNIWLEEKCSDPNCEICKNRPETPNEVANHDERIQNI